MQSGEITFDDFNNRLIELNEGVGGFAELAQKNSAGIETSFSNIKTAVVKGLANVITAIDEGMKDAGLGSISENLNKVKDVVNDVFKGIVAAIPPVIKVITDIYNTIKPFLPLIAALVGYFVTYQAVMGTAKKAIELYNGTQKLMNALMAANPVGLIIAAIVALVAGFIYLWNTSEDFRNFWIGLWESIKKAVSSAVEWIQKAWSGTKEWFIKAWDGVGEFFSNLWKGITNTVSSAVESVQSAWNGVKDFFTSLWDGIKQSASDTWDNLTSTVSDVFGKIITPFKPLISWFSDLWSNIGSIVEVVLVDEGKNPR